MKLKLIVYVLFPNPVLKSVLILKKHSNHLEALLKMTLNQEGQNMARGPYPSIEDQFL
jgi:hypothetical protein